MPASAPNVIYDANGNIVSVKWGEFDAGLRDVNFGNESLVYSRVGFSNLARLLPQKTACGVFADALVASIGVGSQVDAGRVLARWAGGGLVTAANKNKTKIPSGFQAKYVAGGQNFFALVHIAGVAGATLIGPNRLDPYTGSQGSKTGNDLVADQFAQDRAELQLGLNRQRMGLKYTGADGPPEAAIKGYDPHNSLSDYIAEKHAELWDDGAGVSVGRTLERLFQDKNFTRREARNEIFNLLCDR